MATRKSKKSKSKGPSDENSLNYTLNDSYWMDSFDKLMIKDKKPLRERNIFKRNVRVSYNRDSSLENPSTDEEKDFDVVDLKVVASTPRFKSAPKTYSRGKQSEAPPQSKPIVDKPTTSKLSVPKNMFFNFISTPTTRKSNKSLNLSTIVSSEGEPSIWERIAFPNVSNLFQRMRSSGGDKNEGARMLDTPDKKNKAKKTSKKRSTTSKGRKSEKPKVLFNVPDDTQNDGNSLCAKEGRKTDNFVLKPGKWRKSIVNLRRTLNEGGQQTTVAKPKKSIMFNIPEDDGGKESGDRASGKPRATGHWSNGPRISQYHPSRRRKSIFIPSHPELSILVNNVDEPEHNSSKNDLLAQQSDDDRDRGLTRPKSSGFFGQYRVPRASTDRQRTTNGRSLPATRKSSAKNRLDVELGDLLADQLCLAAAPVLVEPRPRRKTDKDQPQRDLLNESSVQLLQEEGASNSSSSSSSSSSCGSICSDEDHPDAVIEVPDDLVVGNKFARQLSKSHSVLVEDLSQDIYLLNETGGGKVSSGVGAGDHHHFVRIVETSDEEADEEDRRNRKGTKSLVPCESPTRFCIVDGQVSVRDTVLRYCDQTEPLRFADVYSERVLRQCRKVGEGVYSEVFMYRQLAGEGEEAEGKAIVLKVIPIEGELIVNGEVQKKFDEILSEIIISKELSDLRYDPRNKTEGFVNVERVRCVRGKYPSYLVDLWDLYNDNHGSDNDHPEVFDDDQLFIVLELENAGQDLEAFNFTNAVQGHSAFLQTVLTLAVAESKYEFEHRDLHWGNILLRHTDEKYATFVLNGRRITVPTGGVQVTIIDYTLSRMLYKRHYLQFNDLAHDEDLFSATGDYQYEIYRLMRKRLGNVWSNFEPYTNVLWLHYMIDKLINGARYRLKQSKKHKTAIREMMNLRDEVTDYKSSVDLVNKLFPLVNN